MKTFRQIWLVLLIYFLAGCQVNTASSSEQLKIISLAPDITEILFALDLEKHIVGITTCCNYPAQTQQIEKVATFSGQANLERILTLKPDMVFATGLEQAPLANELKQLGINVVFVYPQSLDELYADILGIGKLTQREQKAQALVNEMKRRIKAIEAQVALIPKEKRPKVFIEICPDPLITAGSGSFVSELVETAGGRNIAHDTLRPYAQFSPEIVLRRNPDYIILGYMRPEGSGQLLQRMGWQTIDAVKNNQIIADIDPDLILRAGPRVVEGIEKIHARLFR